MPISIKQFQPGHASDVARLHIQGIKTGFLSTLGNRFLMRLYKDIARTQGSIVLVACDDNNSLIGFVAGATDTGKMYKRILFRCGWHYCIMLFPRACNFVVLKKIIETMLYSVRFCRRIIYAAREDNYPYRTLSAFRRAKLRFTKNTSNTVTPVRAELLSIAVDGDNRGKNIGGQLVSALETFLRNHAVTVYKAVTLSTDIAANAFYNHSGFALCNQFAHHENIMNEYHKSL